MCDSERISSKMRLYSFRPERTVAHLCHHPRCMQLAVVDDRSYYHQDTLEAARQWPVTTRYVSKPSLYLIR